MKIRFSIYYYHDWDILLESGFEIDTNNIPKSIGNSKIGICNIEAFEDIPKCPSKDNIFDPVCRICGDPLTTDELICEYCKGG